MLVLSRRVGDSIMVGHDIKVTVLSAGRDHVRIGIEAPRQVEVHREEIYLEIQAANREAAATSEGALAGLAGLAGALGQRQRAVGETTGDPATTGAPQPAAGPTGDPQPTSGADGAGRQGNATG